MQLNIVVNLQITIIFRYVNIVLTSIVVIII